MQIFPVNIFQQPCSDYNFSSAFSILGRLGGTVAHADQLHSQML